MPPARYAPVGSSSTQHASSRPTHSGGGPSVHSLGHGIGISGRSTNPYTRVTSSTLGGSGAVGGRRASASSGANGAGSSRGDLAEMAKIEDFRPPEWRTVLNRRIDLGYPDFYPSRPGFGQTEDILTEENVKNGFTGKMSVTLNAESFSMHGPLYHHLSNGGIDRLMDMGRDIIAARNESMPKIGERTFRIPVRVTYNDSKRQQFLAELSNPSIPLHRLMRTPVPHGFKGVELLDTMFSPPINPGFHRSSANSGANSEPRAPPEPIPIDRAIWFIRVLGSNEISAHRSRTQPATNNVQAPSPAAATPSSTATANAAPTIPLNSNDWYTQEFTNIFTSWLRAQLGQLTIPIQAWQNKAQPNSRQGVLPPKAPAGVLGDEKARARWLVKWSYSMTLLRQMANIKLISLRLLAGWIADFLGVANLAQLGFVAQLAVEQFDEIVDNVYIGRHCIRSSCVKIKEIRAAPTRSSLSNVESTLISIITRLCEANSNVLLSPSTWMQHSELLKNILIEGPDPSRAKIMIEDVTRRNTDLLFKQTVAETNNSPRRQQMAEIQKLDSMCSETNMKELCKAFFSGPSSPTSSAIDISKLEEKVSILLNWAMSLFQFGSHRPYAVYTMLKIWLELYEEKPSTLNRTSRFDFFPILYKWLDTSAAAHEVENALAIGITFGEITRQGIFSYGRYLQTLIARGQTARASSKSRVGSGSGQQQQKSHHLELLRAMPIFVVAKDLLEQRRLALSGDDWDLRRREQAEEEQMLESFKQEVREYVPEIFGPDAFSRDNISLDVVSHVLPTAATLNRYLFLQARFWLTPFAEAALKGDERVPPMSASVFVRILEIYQQCRAYASMGDFVIKGISQTTDEEILQVILDTVWREGDAWTAMDRWQQLTDPLMKRFHTYEKKGKHHRRLCELLLALAENGRLAADDGAEVREALNKAQTAKKFVPPAMGWAEPAQSMPSVRQVLIKRDESNAVLLASKLFTRHGPFENWSNVWWETIVSIVDSSRKETKVDSSLINITLRHIIEVDKLVGGRTLRNTLTTWLEGLAPARITEILSVRNSIPIISFLVSLVIQLRVGSVTILEFLVYPEIKSTATSCQATHPHLSARKLRAVHAAVTLAQQLLLATAQKDLPPLNLREALVLQTARTQVLSGPHVQRLIKHLPDLVVLQHAIMTLPEKTREVVTNLFKSLPMMTQYKTAAFRHLDELKDALLSNAWVKKSTDPTLEAAMVEALKVMMSESAPGANKQTMIPTLEKGIRLSAWRWTRIVLEMRVEFKRLATRIMKNEDAVEARQTMQRLIRSSLDREASNDDVGLLCEAYRGVEPVVVQEILSIGLERLGDLLSQILAAEDQHQVETSAQSIDLVLRVIESTSRVQVAKVDGVGLAARDRLLNLLTIALQAIERQITTEDDVHIHLMPGVDPPQTGEMLKIVIGLLKFALGISGPEVSLPSAPRPDFAVLAAAFLHLCVAIYARRVNSEEDRTMSDMLLYIIDVAPAQALPSIHTALAWETTTPPVQDLLLRQPIFSTALPPVPKQTTSRSMAIRSSHILDDGSSDATISLDDRPWEMFEQMTPFPPRPKHSELLLASKAIKDSSSIPMALFKPQITRDEVPHISAPLEDTMSAENDKDEREEEPWVHYSAERSLGNGLAGEPISARQAATLLYNHDTKSGRGSGVAASVSSDGDDETRGNVPLAQAYASRRRLSSRIASSTTAHAIAAAAATIVSNTKHHGTSETLGSTANQPISIEDDEEDNVDENDDDDDDDDDDSEPVNRPPAGKRPRVAAKSSGKTTSAAHGRQTTGGKAIARKSTGGKSVARKATGGKSIRGTASKSTKTKR